MQQTRPTRALAGALVLGALASSATAQSFNVDLGTGLAGTVPLPVYGAAASQPGVWNDIPVAGNQPLQNLAGTMTTVNLEALGAANFIFDNIGTFGDDQALMDDIIDAPSTVRVTGLAPGPYTIYTYAWAPDDAIHITRVTVAGSPDPAQNCGGIWPGNHQLGVTYVRHALVIGPGLNDLVITFANAGGQFTSLNGVQIVQGPTSPGTNYCTANNNSTGSPAVISASGTGTVAQNNLTLRCANMPLNSFGFFLTSTTQGFVAGPGGSQGNLCLGGAIGRYVGLGQIKNSGTLGQFSLALNLTQHPTPSGFVSVMPGQVWNFTCWFRDVSGGVGTSNFSNGLSVTFN